jgi:putative nucleotidyltransferase with HDIG domain
LGLMQLNIQTLIPLFATVTYGGVLLVVVFSKTITNLHKVFLWYLASMFIWSVSALIILGLFGNAVVWFRILVAAAILSMISLFYFVQTLLAQRRWWTHLVFWYGILAISVTLFTNLVVENAYIDSGHLVYFYNPLIVLVAGPGYGLNIFSLVELIRGYNRTDSNVQRTRFWYLIVAIGMILTVSVINWTELGKYPIDIAVNGVSALLIAYAILRYSLLDIRFVFRTGLLYSIITGITGVLYYLVITLTLKLFEAYTGWQIATVVILVALIASLLLSPLYQKTQEWVDRIFYRQKYDASLMMQRLSEATATLMDLEKISDLILNEIISTMQLTHASFFTKYERGEVYQLVSRQGLQGSYIDEYRADHPIVEWLSQGSQVLTKHQLSIDPVFKSLWSSERHSIESQGIELFISLVDDHELVGFFAVGAKRSGTPFTLEDQRILVTLANQTTMAIKNARLYNELQDTFVSTVVTLANAIDIRDNYTSDHSQRIAALAVSTARAMGCSSEDVQNIYWGSLLHDIGKIGIPDSILLKAGPLNEEEWAVIKSHPTIGANIIQPIKQLAHIAPIIQYNHEWYDGRGYPAGIAGKDIPLGARIVAVVDAFSAMLDERVYKEASSLEGAIQEIHRCSGTQFDPQVVMAFSQVLESHGMDEIVMPTQQGVVQFADIQP